MPDPITIDPSEFTPSKIDPKDFVPAKKDTSAGGLTGFAEGLALGAGTNPPPAPTSLLEKEHPNRGWTAAGLEEGGRLAAITGGEAVGAMSDVPGGTAIGGGTGGLLADAVIAHINNKVYGTPIDTSKKALAEDFIANAGASGISSLLGRFLKAGQPAEQQAIRDAAEHSQVARETFTEQASDVAAAGDKKLADLKADQAKEAERTAKTTEATRQKLVEMQKALPAKAQTQLGKVSPQARMEAIQNVTGRTPETAAHATLPELSSTAEGKAIAPSPEVLARQGGPRGAYFGVRNRLGDAYGAQYEEILRQHGQNSVTDVAPVHDVIGRWQTTFANEGREPTKAVKDLFDAAERISPGTGDEFDQTRQHLAITGTDPEAIAGMSNKQLENYRRQFQANGMLDPEEKGTTVQQMLAYKRVAQKVMVSSTDDRTREIAAQLADGANEVLGKTGGLPDEARAKLGQLNSQWADYKRMFPRTDIRTMATTQTPIEAAEHIFNNPTLTDRVVANATPSERKSLQESFGDWAQLHPEALIAKTPAQAAINARIYGRLYPGTIFADPQAVTYVGSTLQNLSSTPEANKAFNDAMQPEYERIAQQKQQLEAMQAQMPPPQPGQPPRPPTPPPQPQMSPMQQRFIHAWQQQEKENLADGAKGVRNAGLHAAKMLGGPAGIELTKRIQAANLSGGPQAAAKVAIDFFTGLTPEQFVQQIAKGQSRFGGSEATKYLGKQGYGFWLKRMATDPETWKFLVGLGAAQAILTGRPSWYLEIGGIGAPMMLQRFMTNDMVKGLADPVVARALLNGSKAAKYGLMKPLTQSLMHSMATDVGAHLVKTASGITLEPIDEEEPEGAEAP